MTLAQRLAAALTAGNARDTELLLADGGDDVILPGSTPVYAAVLVPITDRDEPGVILTERSSALRQHAGQIAFPGGRVDCGDADSAAAALREAEEELGIPATQVKVIGAADRYRTITGYEITPVLGVVPPDLPLIPNPGEVADWFEMPLTALLDPSAHVTNSLEYQGQNRQFYEIFWEGRRIWGATAAIVVNLSRRLQWLR